MERWQMDDHEPILARLGGGGERRGGEHTCVRDRRTHARGEHSRTRLDHRLRELPNVFCKPNASNHEKQLGAQCTYTSPSL